MTIQSMLRSDFVKISEGYVFIIFKGNTFFSSALGFQWVVLLLLWVLWKYEKICSLLFSNISDFSHNKSSL